MVHTSLICMSLGVGLEASGPVEAYGEHDVAPGSPEAWPTCEYLAYGPRSAGNLSPGCVGVSRRARSGLQDHEEGVAAVETGPLAARPAAAARGGRAHACADLGGGACLVEPGDVYVRTRRWHALMHESHF